MIDEVDWGPSRRFLAGLERLRDPFASPEGQAALDRVRDILVEDNRQARVDGLDKDGRALPPVRAETARHRKGGGPRYAPEGPAAAVVTRFGVAIATAPGAVTITAGWSGVSWVRYAPEIRGVRPEALDRARRVIEDFLARRAGGT